MTAPLTNLPSAPIRPASLVAGELRRLPVAAALALSACFLADSAFTGALLAINWPAWLSDFEHVGSTWANRILPAAALLVAMFSDRVALRWLLVALPFQAAATHMLKFLVGRVRPVDACDSIFFQPFSLIHEGWPSGHAALAWTIALVFARRGSGATLPLAFAATYVCWARLHTFAHFPSDLLAGAIVAWLATESASLAFPRWIGQSAAADDQAPFAPRRRHAALWLAALLAPAAIAVALGDGVPKIDRDRAQTEIAALYQQYLGRAPDEPGLAAYTSQRIAGLPLVAIARDILDSDESRTRLLPLAPKERVAQIYRLLRGREPSEEELARDAPLLADLSRGRGRLMHLLMRLTWGKAPR